MCLAYHNVSLLEFNIQKFYTHDLFDIVEMCKRIEFNQLRVYFKVLRKFILFEKKNMRANGKSVIRMMFYV